MQDLTRKFAVFFVDLKKDAWWRRLQDGFRAEGEIRRPRGRLTDSKANGLFAEDL